MAREIPQYISQLTLSGVSPVPVGLGLQSQARTLEKASQQATNMAIDMFEKSNRITELTAITDLRENLHRISEESGADPAAFKANAEGFVKGWTKSIKAPALAEKLELQARNEMLPYIDKAASKYNRNLDIEQETAALRAQQQNIATVGSIAPNLYSAIPEQRRAAQESLMGIFDESAATATIKKADGTFMFSPEQQLNMAADAQKELIISLPPEKRLQALSANNGGFDESIATVLENEGGYNPSDGGTGVPVNFGINQKAHPDVDVRNLTQQQAIDIYKKDYWDFYKIGDLRADQQAIVMDGVVNHGALFKQRLVDAARNGAAPSELLEMRRKEYDRLSATGKYPDNVSASWEKRLASFEHFSIGEHLALIPGSMREKLKESTLRELNAEMKLRADDPAKWGGQRGMSTAQIVAMQGDPATASVLPKEGAKTIVSGAEQFNSADDIVNLAGQLVNQYQEFAPNALNDLVKEKLPLAQATALNLAMKDPAGNLDRIRILHEVSKAGNDGINKAYKEATSDNPKQVTERIFDEHEDYISAAAIEGVSIDQINSSLDLSASVAKAYRIKNPNVGVDDAVAYAFAQDIEQYKIAEINNSKFRVPAYDKTGMVINADVIERRVSEALTAMPDSSFVVSEADSALLRSSRKSMTELARPYLNSTADGVKFRTPAGDVLRNKDGSPVQFMFKEVIAFPTKSELKEGVGSSAFSFGKRQPVTLSDEQVDFTKTPSNLAN